MITIKTTLYAAGLRTRSGVGSSGAASSSLISLMRLPVVFEND